MKLIEEIKKEKTYWVSVLLVLLSIGSYLLKVPNREMILLGSFTVLIFVFLFKVLK